jgi:hypothetical protein
MIPKLVEWFRQDNGNDHRAGTIILQAEKSTRKSGFVCIVLLCGVIPVLVVAAEVVAVEERNPCRA